MKVCSVIILESYFLWILVKVDNGTILGGSVAWWSKSSGGGTVMSLWQVEFEMLVSYSNWRAQYSSIYKRITLDKLFGWDFKCRF